MELRLLGPVELWCAGSQVPLGPRQRAVLVALAILPGRPVSATTLIERVWGEELSGDGRSVLYNHLSRLRAALKPPGGGNAQCALRRSSSGYLLDLDPQQIDLFRARRLAAEARSLVRQMDDRLDEALEGFRGADALWREPPLAGVSGSWVERTRHALSQEHLTMVVERYELELRLGRLSAVIGSLAELHTQHPLAEAVTALLMQSLAHSGQHGEALAVYARARRHTVDDLGVEPGPELQRLHQQILRGDLEQAIPHNAASSPSPGVTTHAEAAVRVAPAQVPPGNADEPAGAAEGEPTDPVHGVLLPVPDGGVPSQLPAEVAAFTGRVGELEALDELVSGDRRADSRAVVISAVTGTAGVGKTALVVRWAHRVADRFPDGQLFIDLRGYAPGSPLQPVEALGTLLRSLGVPPDRVPADEAEAAGLFRSLLKGRRVLVVLDNARSADQVRPLLPGDPRCMAVVTSRDRLSGLVSRDGAHRLALDVLTAGEAVGLLGQLLGTDRVRAEPDAAAELARSCALLPLALRIAAADLVDHRDRNIAAHVAELAATGLAGLDADGSPDQPGAVRAAFDLSYQAIPPEVQRMFRLLGLVPGPDVTPAAAAALAGGTTLEAGRLLHRLAGAHLCIEHAPGRYTCHDLLRAYAREHAAGEPDPDAAVGRLLDWYLSATDTAAQLLYPEVSSLPVPAPHADLPPVGFDDIAGAQAWLDGERSNLVAAIRHAAQHGPRHLAWLLADRLRGHLWQRWGTVDWLTIGRAALQAAAHDKDPRAQASASLSLGGLHRAIGRYPQAIEHYTAALDFSRQADWDTGQTAALAGLGTIHRERGQLRLAVGYYSQALNLLQPTDRPSTRAAVLAHLGCSYQELGQLTDAAEHLTHAADLYRRAGAVNGEAHAVGNLGEVSRDLGRLDLAREQLSHSLTLYRQLGDRYGQANALQALAAVDRDAGRHADALHHAQAATALAGELKDPHTQASALNTLASIELIMGSREQAVEHHQRALHLATRCGADLLQAGALAGLATTRLHQGRPAEAGDHAQRALDIARPAGYRLLQAQALTTLAESSLAQGDHADAADHARQAIDIHKSTGHRLGQARALLTLGHAVQHAGHVETARDHWLHAADLLTNIGSPEATQAHALIDASHTC